MSIPDRRVSEGSVYCNNRASAVTPFALLRMVQDTETYIRSNNVVCCCMQCISFHKAADVRGTHIVMTAAQGRAHKQQSSYFADIDITHRHDMLHVIAAYSDLLPTRQLHC